MSRIYLDSNVFSNLRTKPNEFYRQLAEGLERHKPNLSFFFSLAHICDKKKDLSDFKFLDFDFIESFTGDNYLAYHPQEKRPNIYLATPRMVYDDHGSDRFHFESLLEVDTDAPPAVQAAQRLFHATLNLPLPEIPGLSNATDDQRAFLGKIIPSAQPNTTILDFSKGISELSTRLREDSLLYRELRKKIDEGINNGKYTLQDEGVVFNESLKDSELQQTFVDFVKSTVVKERSGETEYYDFFLLAYQCLDLLGIKKDSVTTKNGLPNMMNDGLHAYFGAYCDFLVTADNNLRIKAKALYLLLDRTTQVLSVEEFLEILPKIGATTDASLDTFIDRLLNEVQFTERTKSTVQEDGREQFGILTTKRYLNFFDHIHVVLEQGYTHYFLRRKLSHILAPPNFREQVMILERCLKIFDLDHNEQQLIDWTEDFELIKKGEWPGAVWNTGNFTITLERHPALQEFCILLSFPPKIEKRDQAAP